MEETFSAVSHSRSISRLENKIKVSELVKSSGLQSSADRQGFNSCERTNGGTVLLNSSDDLWYWGVEAS